MPGKSLTGADRKAMREAMVRAVPQAQRDKLRGINEGFLGPMLNCSAEVRFYFIAFSFPTLSVFSWYLTNFPSTVRSFSSA